LIRSSAAPWSDLPRAVYDDAYADRYEALYLDPWPAKHAVNRCILDALLPRAVRADQRWLDLCCGQAWHFSCYPDMRFQTGVDLSPAQLKIARTRNPRAEFVCADVLEAAIAPASFDLITCFWGAYCYLDDFGRIATFLRRVVEWTAPAGAVYLELLAPDVLASFNTSNFAERTGFHVEPRSADYTSWAYSDAGGRHLMTSPTREWLIDRLAGHFSALQVHHDGGFMSHLVATGRRSDQRAPRMLALSEDL
jgi:SAM-dependent methyltransferase